MEYPIKSKIKKKYFFYFLLIFENLTFYGQQCIMIARFQHKSKIPIFFPFLNFLASFFIRNSLVSLPKKPIFFFKLSKLNKTLIY